MHFEYWIQLFADGAAGDGGTGDGTGTGTETGETPPAPGEERAKELGIPARYRKTFAEANKATALPGRQASAQPEQEQAEKAAEVTEEQSNQTERKSLRDMIRADKDLNREVQALIQDALRGRGKEMQSKLDAANAAIAAIAPRYNLDAADMDSFDYAALQKAASEDDTVWESKAADMGVTVEQARALEQAEMIRKRDAAMQQKAAMQQRFKAHIENLRSQGNEVERDFPGQFNFDQAMQDPEFKRMTAPNGISVRQAFLALHGDEVMANANKQIAAGVQQKMANAIAAGAARPVENGTQSQAQTVQRFDYSHMTKEQRAEFMKMAREAWNRGEKVHLM